MAIDPVWFDIAKVGGAVAGISGVVGIVGQKYFVTKKACAAEQTECKTNICKKIDELKDNQIRVFDKLEAIAHHMGAVEQFMRDRQGGGP